MSRHPSESQLKSFCAGMGASDFRNAVKAHIRECNDCRTKASLYLDVRPSPEIPHSLSKVDERKIEIPSCLVQHKAYEVLGTLGVGGMSRVFKVVHRITGRDEAVKILSDELSQRPEIRERFLREIRSAAKLDHPHIIRTLGAFEENETLGLVMEFRDGTDLAHLIRDEGRLPWERACHFISQVCSGLEYASSMGMVHRDIKPANLLVSNENGVEVIRILDFGLIRLVDSGEQSGQTQDARILGTPDYISPEQINAPSRVDIRSDIYSLGCTFYAMLTGRPPFVDSTPMQKIASHLKTLPPRLAEIGVCGIPEQIESILIKMLEKDPKNRFQSPSLVRQALEAAQSRPASSVPPPVPEIPTTSFDAESFAVAVNQRRLKARTRHPGKRSVVGNLMLATLKLAPLTALLCGAYFYRDKIPMLVEALRVQPQSAQIVFQGFPENSMVSIDGQLVDFKALEIDGEHKFAISPGLHSLRVMVDGDVYLNTTFQVASGQNVNLNYLNKKNLLDSSPTTQPKIRNVPQHSTPPLPLKEESPASPPSETPAFDFQVIDDLRRAIGTRDIEQASKIAASVPPEAADVSSTLQRLLTFTYDLKRLLAAVNQSLYDFRGVDLYPGTDNVPYRVLEVNGGTVNLLRNNIPEVYSTNYLPGDLEQFFISQSLTIDRPSRERMLALAVTTAQDRVVSAASINSYGLDRSVVEQLAFDLQVNLDIEPLSVLPISPTHTLGQMMQVENEEVVGVQALGVMLKSATPSRYLICTKSTTDSAVTTSIWDVATNTRIPLPCFKNKLIEAQISDSGKVLVTRERKGQEFEVNVYATPFQAKYTTVPIAKESADASLELATSGKYLTVCEFSDCVRKYNLQARAAILSAESSVPRSSSEKLSAVAFDEKTGRFAGVDETGKLRQWRTDNGTLCREDAKITPTFSIQYSNGGRSILQVQTNGMVRLLQANDYSVESQWMPIRATLKSQRVEIGRYLVSLTETNELSVWDTRDTSPTRGRTCLIQFGHQSSPVAYSFDPSRSEVLIAMIDGSVQLWKPNEDSK